MDDLSGKISELLSDPESMQRIKNLAGMLAGGQNNQNAGYDNSNNNNNYSQQNQQSQPYGGSNFGGNQQNRQDRQDRQDQQNYQNRQDQQPNNQGLGDFNLDPDMIMKLSSAMRVMNQHDPRVDLLMALKENLTEPRQKKVDDAIKILRLLSLMPLLKEQGIFNFL